MTLSTFNVLPFSGSYIRSRWQFVFLVAFIATQGYLIPIIALPSVNWAIWPSFPDIFGVFLVLSVVFKKTERIPRDSKDQEMFKCLFAMWIFFIVNYLIVTIPNSITGDGVKYGGYTLIVFTKLVAVFWAADHIPLNKKRLQVIHIAAMIAFLWLSITTLADRIGMIEIDNFVRHLPLALAGKWNSNIVSLDSTVSSSHGGTTIALLVIGALCVGTEKRSRAWLVEPIVFAFLLGTSFVSGSRQGLVRSVVFIAIYLIKKNKIMPILAMACLISFLFFSNIIQKGEMLDNPYFVKAIERQSILIGDPFSSEGLSGRPNLWISVVDTLNETPIRWLIGYGIGNYTEKNNAAHNMFLLFLQEGGFLELVFFGVLWIKIFKRIWVAKKKSWVMVALSGGMLTSIMTSAVFYPTLGTGWYLGLYFISFKVLISPYKEAKNARERQ